MRVTVTGASGLIGGKLLDALLARGDQITVLSRDPERARRRLGANAAAARQAASHAGAVPPGGVSLGAPPRFDAWEPQREAAPTASLAGRDAVVHLAGENIAQRWSQRAKQAIRDSRVTGTRNLVAGIATCEPSERPRVLVSASAIGYYGPHGDEPIDEEAPAGSGDDFLVQVCVAWENEAQAAERLGLRVVRLRNGVVLDARGGALGKMLAPFRLGVGGPVAGGGQYLSWIHVDDLVGMALAALEDERWRGAVNATAPEPATNGAFSKALGRALNRPALLPVPGAALRLLYGEMAQIVTTGARVLPARALVLGYRFRHPQLEEALRAALR
jgi:uncharacterized protein